MIIYGSNTRGLGFDNKILRSILQFFAFLSFLFSYFNYNSGVTELKSFALRIFQNQISLSPSIVNIYIFFFIFIILFLIISFSKYNSLSFNILFFILALILIMVLKYIEILFLLLFLLKNKRELRITLSPFLLAIIPAIILAYNFKVTYGEIDFLTYKDLHRNNIACNSNLDLKTDIYLSRGDNTCKLSYKILNGYQFFYPLNDRILNVKA